MTASSYRRYLASFAPGLAMSLGLLVLVAVLFWQLLSVSDSTSSLISNLGPRDWQVVRFTTLQAGLSVILSLMVGLPLAWALAQQRTFPGRSLLIAVFSSALVLPTLVVVLGLVTVLGRAGWLNMALEQSIGTSFGVFLYGFSGVLIAHTYLNGSFAVRAILNRLEAIPVEKQKLSTSLGLSTWHHFLLVEWPAMRSTLPGISALIFLMCFTSFAIVLTLGGNPSFNTLEVAIYEAAKFDFDIPRALDLALLQLAICAVFVIFASSFRASHGIIGQRQSHGFRRPGRAIGFFQLALITLLAICFLLPLLAILIDGLRTDFGRLFGEATFLKALATSLVIATSSSLLTEL